MKHNLNEKWAWRNGRWRRRGTKTWWFMTATMTSFSFSQFLLLSACMHEPWHDDTQQHGSWRLLLCFKFDFSFPRPILLPPPWIFFAHPFCFLCTLFVLFGFVSFLPCLWQALSYRNEQATLLFFAGGLVLRWFLFSSQVSIISFLLSLVFFACLCLYILTHTHAHSLPCCGGRSSVGMHGLAGWLDGLATELTKRLSEWRKMTDDDDNGFVRLLVGRLDGWAVGYGLAQWTDGWVNGWIHGRDGDLSNSTCSGRVCTEKAACCVLCVCCTCWSRVCIISYLVSCISNNQPIYYRVFILDGMRYPLRDGWMSRRVWITWRDWHTTTCG